MTISSSTPDVSMPSDNQQALLSRRPTDIPQASDFEIRPAPIPELRHGEFLVRNLFLSVDPAQRGWAAAAANYSDPVPLGSPMRALAIGVVVSSKATDVEDGALLYGWFGWQLYCAARPEAILLRATLPAAPSSYLSLLGINGLTAYLALTQMGRPETGDTLLVSTAAGSVGSFVGQIGKLLGCRTIGLTGSADKVARCVDRFGYDVAIDYKSNDWTSQLERALPGGTNVYYDNTGGPILDIALRTMAVGGRIVQCGTASIASWDPLPQGPRNEREILTRRLQWGGFVIFDHASRFDAAAGQLHAWHEAGQIIYDEDISIGLHTAPGAIAELYAGANLGKRIIDVR